MFIKAYAEGRSAAQREARIQSVLSGSPVPATATGGRGSRGGTAGNRRRPR